MNLPTSIDYPIIAIGDLHGQIEWLDRLVTRLERLPELPAARLVFLGDLVDRNDSVKSLVSRVMELIASKPGSTCVMGNHDLALIRAAGLDGLPSDWWARRYADNYDHVPTFRSYLGKVPEYYSAEDWRNDLRLLRYAIPPDQRRFLAGLPWVAEAGGHLFLHNGLSPELECPATVQVECLKRRIWTRESVNPRFGTDTDRLFTTEYPVWLGADKKLSANPLPLPGKVQVTGHVRIDEPEIDRVRIRIDTSGGVREPLTACVLRGPNEPPRFVFSNAQSD
ncbi:MAG TPA: metallophosphoesterase [Gemmata sp.]|nr:metallophosphoesterase [Gemmata sp.]